MPVYFEFAQKLDAVISSNFAASISSSLFWGTLLSRYVLIICSERMGGGVRLNATKYKPVSAGLVTAALWQLLLPRKPKFYPYTKNSSLLSFFRKKNGQPLRVFPVSVKHLYSDKYELCVL
jgi:hypothetical protein